MKRILVTGGTVFVSRYIAEYYVKQGCEVWVLNRNTRPQPEGVHLIECDRHDIGGRLKGITFDAVIDVTAYNADDVICLTGALGDFGQYVMISSSAVYPESAPQPFDEAGITGENRIWGSYGAGKLAAEKALRERVSDAYILRPPYLYGPMNNVYREAFVFDCAEQNRPFYLPREGEMKLQFFHVRDLCRFIDIILCQHPEQHVFNVGNRESVSVREWVTLCFATAGKTPEFINVYNEPEQRRYFCFYDYQYSLSVERQCALMPDTVPLAEGLKEAYGWYLFNRDMVNVRPLIEYIDNNLK